MARLDCSSSLLMIEEFMVCVPEISESLILVGDPIPLRNLIEIVLDALPEEYDPIVATVNSKVDFGSLDELESCLLAHESRLEKHQKVVLTEPVSVNLTPTPLSLSPVTTEHSATGMESFPLGTSHATANAENHGYNSRGGCFDRRGPIWPWRRSLWQSSMLDLSQIWT